MERNPTQLSVAIIARDEAAALAETIRSVQPVADEIVVLDTGSMDASRSEARRLGARVFDFNWCDDFSAARNACLDHVEGEWVLWLDVGETMAADDLRDLKQFVQQQAARDKAYAMLVRVVASSASSAAEQVARIRLVPNRPPLRFSGRVRESLLPAMAEDGLVAEGLPYVIHRGKREHVLARRIERARRNVKLAELELRENPHQPQILNCLGDAFQTLQDNDRAVQFFHHALQAAQPDSTDALEAYYGLLTSLDNDANRQRQLDLAVQASEAFPLDAQLLCAVGGYLQAMGRTDIASQSYETAVRYGQVNPSVWHVAEVHQIAAICYSVTLQLLDKLDEAVSVLEQALEAESSVRVRKQLIDLLAKRGLRDRALEHVGKLPKETPHREALRSAVRGACLAAQENWIAAKAYLKAAYAAGCREAMCLRWYAVALSNAGERAEAIRILEEWRLEEPANGEVTRLLAAAQSGAAQAAAPGRQLRVDTAGDTLPNASGPAPFSPSTSEQDQLGF